MIILNNFRTDKIGWPCERYFHKFQENGRKCGFMIAIKKQPLEKLCTFGDKVPWYHTHHHATFKNN